MKVFWSWQSDTPGKIGRHFIRDALQIAIDELKGSPDLEEPTAAATREKMHLDHDREGVSGSPSLAETIFRKIDAATVFVADVTLTGVSDDGSKRVINSNVGIEYGHAHGRLGDKAILMVQNTYYGGREVLPFDLKHKAGPIQFHLGPEAKKPEIEKTRKALAKKFVEALRQYIQGPVPVPPEDRFALIHKELSALTGTQSFFKSILLQVIAGLAVIMILIVIAFAAPLMLRMLGLESLLPIKATP